MTPETIPGMERYSVRTTGNLIDTVQLEQDPLVTELVIGQPQFRPLMGERIMRRILVRNFNFDWTTLGTEHLEDIDTERAMRAPIRTVDWEPGTGNSRLRRFSLGVRKDQDEIRNAHSILRMRERSAMLAKRIVTLNIERIRRDLLLDSATYPAGHVVTIGGGDEWDTANGDSKTDVGAAAAAVAAATGLMTEDLVVALAKDSYEAAKLDPVFLAARQNIRNDGITAQELARYWDVKRVDVYNAVEKDSAGAIVPMYSDKAVVYYEGGPQIDTEFGDFEFAVTFGWGLGVASVPYWDPHTSTWVFPWTDYADPQVISSQCAALIENCSSLV